MNKKGMKPIERYSMKSFLSWQKILYKTFTIKSEIMENNRIIKIDSLGAILYPKIIW